VGQVAIALRRFESEQYHPPDCASARCHSDDKDRSNTLGNLSLDFSRTSGYFPDIVMGGPAPLQALHKLGVVEPQVRTFSKNRGRALVVRKGNPLDINGLTDVARTGARLAQADRVEAAARAGNIAAVEALVGKSVSDAVFAHEVEQFPGRLGITHRNVPEALARDYADVGLTQYHLISYWARTFPNHFELVPITGAERFPSKIRSGHARSRLSRISSSAGQGTFIPATISHE
jgi:hypothetical protein